MHRADPGDSMITAHGPTHFRRGGARRIAAWTGIALLALAHAQTAVLDCDNLTWIPERISNLSETYPIAGGNVTISFSGNTSGGEQFMRNVEVQVGEAAPSGAVTPGASAEGVPTGDRSASPDVDNAVDGLDSGDPAAASGSAGPDDQAAAAHSRKKRIRSVWRSLTDFFVGPAYAELQ